MDEVFKNVVFLFATGFVTYHGLTFRDEEGNTDTVRLLFGSIAFLFFVRVLVVDVMGVDVF